MTVPALPICVIASIQLPSVLFRSSGWKRKGMVNISNLLSRQVYTNELRKRAKAKRRKPNRGFHSLFATDMTGGPGKDFRIPNHQLIASRQIVVPVTTSAFSFGG